MTRESRLYWADQQARDTAFKLVPKAASTGYEKACKAVNFILHGEAEPKFSSPAKQAKLRAARKAYLDAVSA